MNQEPHTIHFRQWLLLSVTSVIAIAGCGSPSAEVQSDPVFDPADRVVVYFFHRTLRCPACEKIEWLARQAVEDEFVSEMATGKLLWCPVNLDEPAHAHYADRYQLQFQSVVVSEIRGGNETSWKNLKKVWDLLDDDEAMRFYIRDEVRASLENQEEWTGS